MPNPSPTHILREARTWLDTPFCHQGRKKGVGVDCLGVLVGVARALRLRAADGSFLATHDSLAYGHYPDEATLRAGLDGCLQSLSHGERDCPRLDRGSKNAEHFSGEGLQQNSEQVEGSSHPHPKSHLMDVISTSPSGRGLAPAQSPPSPA
jgi:hypothetical protein